jgi:glycerophosphoryl diester phosphodiesterase
MAAIRTTPAIGICSDRPELVHPFAPPADWKVGIVCHRGANVIAPENSLPAIECAFAASFDVEVDLRATSDGQTIILHDATLDRTTNGTGKVAEQTLAEVRRLDAGRWKNPFFAGTPVPTLAETLSLAGKYQGALYLELKACDPAAVWAEVQAHDLAQEVFFWSFDHDLVRAMRTVSSDARLMARRLDYATLDDALASWAPAVIEYAPDEDLAEFTRLRDLGILPMIVYMGDDDAVFDQMIAARPALVNIDQPFRFARRIAHHFPRDD